MRTFILCILALTAFTSLASISPLPLKIPILKTNITEPCEVTVTDHRTFYVYNCGQNSYTTTITATCKKTASTCGFAATSAMNCVDATLTSAGGDWQKGIREKNCPEQLIDWID